MKIFAHASFCVNLANSRKTSGQLQKSMEEHKSTLLENCQKIICSIN